MASEQTVELPRPELSPAKRALLEAMLKGQVRASGIVPRVHRDGAPLSFAQERLWFLDRLEPGSAVYNIPGAWRLAGALDTRALERALGEIVRRHEALRTVFAEVDGSPVQVIAPFGGFTLGLDDLSGLPDADREAELGRRAAEEAMRPYDLTAGPVFRAGLLRLGAEDHVLLLSMHHIVSDGWSNGVLFGELSALYTAYREGGESPLPELPVQYADYALWQREQLKGEALERHLSYWRERLAGAPELLELPTDHPRPAVQTFRGALERIALPGELLERLQALGRSEEATLFMVVLAAFQVLLSKYSGSDDIVVGSPIAGRTRKEVAGLIGFFVNTLVLRSDLGGDPSFREALRRVREATLGAYAHQEVPFEKLVAELQPERSSSHSPLFQVMFTLENAGGGGGGGGGLPGLEVSGLGAELASAKFDLSLGLTASDQGLRGGLSYSTDLFERGTIERMLGHLARVLEQVAVDADVRLSRLDLLAAGEREQVLGTWNHTERADSDPPAHALFAEWARRAPEAVALLDGGEAVSYGELDRRAAALARHLRGLGVGPETPVGLCMERTPELLVGVLGIWKAGGAYVPLDPAYPAERLGWIIADAALSVVVATGGTAGVLPEHGATLVRVDQLAETAAESAPEVPACDASLAYVIYTSGSTGRPKGVLVQHGSLANLLAATREAFGVVEGDVMPALASYAFDIWLFEALLPLTSGAAVRLVDRERVLDVPALVEEIADATLVHAVPALMRQLVQAEREKPRLARLRRAFVGGDRVPADLLAEMRAALPGAETHVLYGPTEGTILASTHPVDGIVEGHPIGRPLGNVRLYVCDALGSPQPAGIPGELLIGGAGVARGYLGRAGLTAERFVPDPFSVESGARLYRTGDRARWRVDGTLEYLGRVDQQVKIRGFRIEPGEIEAVLRQHDRVAECVVVARDDGPGDRRLVAYVVPVPREDVELWPSIGEYFVYDDLIYHGLTHDTLRNGRYLRALQRHAPGKVVLDVGTGADAILARLAVEAGARHVYAVELLEKSYLSARGRVRELGLEDRITVIHGDAQTVELPELAEVCVSEIVEAIAGGEGAAAILNQARRLLAPGAVMIPGSARTRVAAVTLPDELRHASAFSPTAAHYVKRIFEEVGFPFDLRLCIRNFPADRLLSTVGTYEDLDFGAGPVDAEYTRREELVVERAGRMDGLLLWLWMELAEGEELDILEEETAWFPVYFPLFDPGIEVAAGDRLRVECWARIPDGVAPDYGARGVLVRGRDGEEVPFEFVSYHHRQEFRASPFYRRLFADGEVPALEPQGETLPASLRGHARQSLPEYMVPSAFVVLDALPLTPNGKLDRKALPAPELASAETRYVAPRTPTEEVLAGIWVEVLRVERVGANDNFFELGGHSLLATRVVSRVRELFAVELPLRVLFERPTVSELAERVEEMRRAELPVLPPVVPTGRTGALPLSFAQERLWFIDRLEPGSAVYNMPMARRLAGALDQAALERSLGEIVRRHEALRTVFAEVDGSPVQVVAPFGGFVLPVEDLSGLSEADREAAVRRRAADEAARPFDLSAGPLFRAALLRLGAEDHLLLLSMHHIVSDGWSMGVLFRELSALYEAYREGRESPLPELAVQYADYAVWQREQLAGEVLDRQLAYWRERLAGAPELLELPTDHPRLPMQTYRGARVPVELSPELLERLQALGHSEGATLYMTLLCAFQVLLSKYSGSEDVVVGSPIAGRTRGEVEELIGFFVNNLVLRTDLGGDPSFRETLRRVREVMLGAYEHQELPFEKLVAELQPERSLSHSPLFQVVFTLDDAEESAGDAAEPSTEGGDTDFTFAKVDLALALAATRRGLRGGLIYATDLFERGTVERMLGHLARVLEQVAANADVRLSRLELLGDAERALVLQEWNGTAAEVPADLCIHELFEAQVDRSPDAAALVFDDETLCYAELNARANQLAHHLAGLGVGPEVRVGICLERGTEMVVSVLAVLKAGGAYVPLDPAYPAERLAFVLADAAVPVLVTQESLRAALPAGDGVAVVSVDGDGARIASESVENPERGVSPDHVAYVIYTSGSTGTPKGVMVPHRGVPNLAYAQARRFGIDSTSRVLQFASFSFDAAVAELFDTLLAGATLVLASREALLPGEGLLETLRSGRVTVATLPPSVLAILPPDDLPELRTVVSAGEAVDVATVARWSEGCTFVNAYGPTEVTVCATAAPCQADGRVPAIGRPLENVRVYVLDGAGGPAPVGVPGELYVGGMGVARGYLGRPGLTAERFVPDPFGGELGARLYRTGDRVRWSAGGELEFQGRVDEQVKVRGFRIEPGEVEAALRQAPGVRDCTVVVREDESGDRRLVAYVVGEAEADALRDRLRQGLPEYMVPSAFVALDRLPLTANGKVDRKALPAPEYALAETYVAPRTPVEEVLAGIWAEVLRLERVGVEESFFELGGHSLLATRMVSRIREVFGVEVPLRALFEGPTVAELAGRVEEMRRAGEGAALPPLVPVAREAPLPLSFAQERLWFLHQMEPEGAGYNMHRSGRLRGTLDADALERALGELVSRHESLRTTFRPVEQGAVQVVHPAAPARLPVVDLTGLAPRAREDEARRLAREEADRPFDLERGPLLRATLVRLADDEHVLLLAMHHIVSDGWSMGVLFRELFTLYEAFSLPSGAAASPLPPLAVQYADFAVWQRGWLQGEVLQRHLDWWRERLGGAPPALELPTDRPRPAVASSRGASLLFRLPAEVTRGLHSLARREGATLYMVTHAILDLLLSRWSGQEDLVVGSPIAGRTQVGTEGLIGFFVNTLVLRVDLSGDPSFQELVRRVRETALGAYAHQELPFERLVEEVAPERGLSHTPLFQVMFQLQNVDAGQGSGLAGIRSEPFEGEIRTVRFDLELDLHAVDEELLGSLRYRTDLFDAATMERFAAQYGVVLAAAAASPEERLSRLAILPDQEARTLLAYGSGPAREDAGGVPVHLLFAEQAARTPNAPALLFAGESLTYAELDARAERLALRLRGLGVAIGRAVAVCLERGPEAVVALLAIWKAGGVYLPLDPSHPVERLAFFLHDSGAKLVVSDLPLAGALLEREADVLLLDPSAEEDLPGGALEPRGGGGPGDLAYLIYTSGSTGTPKAVMVEHAHLTHTLRASLETLGFAPGDVVAALASTAFDISLLELVTPLLAGGAVRIVSPEVARDPETLVDAAGDVTVLHAVPALMRQVVEAVRGGRTLPSLRLLLVGGDTVAPDLLEDMRALFPAARTRVLYGPTEGTIICATYAVPAEGTVAGHPLGRPLPGVRLAVRGPRGEMAPVGVPGEVWISGGGVARGYLGRPELNAEKFVSIDGERAYRTGDRARWRADGVLEFLGRADEQVKVRGFRIELGEIEAGLRGQPGVREAVVLAREDAPGDRRLVAYVVPGADGVETAGGGKEQVSEWETLFDDTYAQDEGDEDPTLALKGWNSSYTGEPIPREEMRAWVEDTAERILALRPERVLEVGCGTGLLLFRVAPHTRAYHGTDFSGVALEHVRRHLAGLPQVSLSEGEADDLAEFAGTGFDVVVVNSVAQYFPDLDYLLRVLEGAAAALRPGGRIFVGDVRSLPLAGAFHASVELARAPEGLPAEQLQARVKRGMAEEQELLLDPALFDAMRARMPRLGRVEVQVKRGEYDNEVSRFRYDVVLHLDVEPAGMVEPVVHPWEGEDAAGLRVLAEGNASALLVRGIPDARVREHVRAYELVSAGGEATDAAAVRVLSGEDAGGIAPEALFALAGELAWGIEVRPGASGTLDVLIHPAGDVAHFPAAVDAERPWESYANDPQWGRRMRALVPALREAARARLPEYMVPSAFVVLEAFPVTANGKVDRGALPAPDALGSRGTYVAPRTPAEERMAGIWAEVLGVERVGAEDHFFELGGHSLLATQLVSRVREAFRTELPLRAVFEAPRLAELVVRVEEMRHAELPVLPPVVPTGRTGPLPLSFAQERLWFIDRLEPGSTAYSLPGAWRLGGALDGAALERSLGEIVRRHEALRTVFGEVDGSPVQVIAPFDGFALPVEDLSRLGEADRESAVRRRTGEEAARPFDLAAGPLFRAALLRLGDEDHVLLLSMHHIVSDGWSVGVLFRELLALYAAYREGRESPLAELPVQYADYAVWQREQLAGEVLDRQLAYWRERLAGAPELLELPTDRPRPAVQTYRGASVPVELPLELLERLQRLGRSEGATLYMVLLGAFQVLLGQYAGSEDVVVGSPIAGRTRNEVEGLIGLFLNTLVLRTDLSENPSFRQTLRQVREATLGAYAHQDVPFEKLVAELQPERSMSHSPLFQVMFTLQNAGDGGGALAGLNVSGAGAELASAQFDLSLTLTATAQGLRGGLSYSTDLFDRGTVDRMLGHLERVLEQVAADPDARLSRLELLGDAERARVLEAWNRTEAEYPADRCIHQLFQAQAARTPNAAALVFQDESLTYAELDARANRLAHHLAGLGAGPEARVGICVHRSAEMVVAMLAVLKAGAAYLPLDPSYPAGRLAYMLQDSGAPLLVTQGSLRGLLPADGVRIVSVDEDAAAIASHSADAPRTSVHAANAAYVIYTSGSTGRPKGVQVTHGNAVSFFAGMDERVGGSAAGTWLALTRISFDIHVLELLWTLARGFRVVVQPEPDRARGGESVAEQVRRHAVTHLQCTPSLAAMMIAESGAGALSGLERVLLGGEALPPDLAAQITAVLPDGLVNMYGPTETTVWSATHAVEAGEAPIPIGRPIANTRVYVLDAALRPQPAGVPGELFIGGHGVARGYLGRPGLTADRFVPDAFSTQPGARLYRTGDRARWREESAEVSPGSANSRTDAPTHSRTAVLEYLGRIDQQVKIRGFRIEPGEVEAVLRRHPDVVECAVVARTAGAGDTRLVAYVVGGVQADALREHLRGSLPEYMVPAAFVPLDALPLTPNGKLDRRALPAPEYAAAGEYVAPRTPAEEVLAGIWAEVLRLERVGVHDSFFDRGGHSLLIMRLLARIQATFDLEISIRTVFSMPTLEAMAGEIERRIYEDAAAMSEFEAEQLSQSNPVAGV